MAIIPLNKIFLGHTPSEQRKYLLECLKFLYDKYPKIVLPAVGQFTLVKVALQAGYAPENIYTSDISLFSALLGALFEGRPISEIDFLVASEYQKQYDECKSDFDRVALVLWLMKLSQISKVHYQKMMYDDLLENRAKHISSIKEQIVNLDNEYHGIHYDTKDLRDELVERDSDFLLVLNPPIIKNGYTKMFDFTDFIEYESGIEEFDFGKEYNSLYENSKSLSYPCIWYRSRDASEYNPDEIIYAKEYEVGKQDYWLCTKPNILNEFPYRKYIESFKTKNLHPCGLPIFTDTDSIDENTKIRFIQVSEEVGLYYRDLFAHKLGNTAAEHYILMLLNDKVFATLGLMTAQLFRLRQNNVFETFGFSSPLSNHPRANRLLMYAITCDEFRSYLHKNLSVVNRVYSLTSFRTTCLSKYRKVKLNNGIMKIIAREKMKNGMYKLLYQTDWHARNFEDCVVLYLSEESKS